MTLPDDPIKWATEAFKDGRNDTYNTIERYLNGDQPIAFATKTFRNAFGSLFESFAYNRLSSVVEAHSDRLQITNIDGKDKGLVDLAQGFWDANQMDVRENESTNDSLSYGDGFISVELHPNGSQPVYWVNDPRLIRVHFDDQIPGRIDLAVKRWVEQDGYAYLNLYFEDHIEKFVTRNKVSNGAEPSASAWTAKEGDDYIDLPVTDTVPVFHLPNKARTNTYGKSELALLIPLQDALNYTLMTGMVATEFGAFTQKVLMGVRPEDDDEKKMMEEFQLGVSKILLVDSENAKIGEFSPNNLEAYMQLAEWWDTSISRVSRVPVHYLRGSDTAESGEAKRLQEQPFTSKIIDMQRQFGYGYGEVNRYGLRLMGHENVQPADIWVNWEDAAPHSEEDRWRLIDMRLAAGVPFRIAMRMGGFDQPEIDEMTLEREQERQQAQRWIDRGAVSVGFGAEGTEA